MQLRPARTSSGFALAGSFPPDGTAAHAASRYQAAHAGRGGGMSMSDIKAKIQAAIGPFLGTPADADADIHNAIGRAIYAVREVVKSIFWSTITPDL
jgi:hypothetical protein